MLKKRGIGIVLSYIDRFLGMACGLLMSSFLLRQIGSTDYGVYQTMSSFATYLVLLEFGMGTVLARNLSTVRSRAGSIEEINRNISTIWTITSILALSIVAVSVVFFVSIDYVYAKSLTPQQIVDGKHMFLLITVYLVSYFVAHTLKGIALAFEHYTYSSTVSIVNHIARTTLLLCLVSATKKVVVVCAVDALLNVCIAVFAFVYCRVKFGVRINYKWFDKSIFKASLPLCIAMFLQTVINQSNGVAGKFVLGVVSGPDDVALYSVGLYIFNIFASLAIIPVWFYVPEVTKSVTSGMEGLQLTKSLIQPSRLIVLVGGTVLFGFFACGRQFISIIYGEQYLLAWTISILLVAPAFLNESISVVLNVLDAKNKRHVRSILLMFTTVLNIVGTIYGVGRFGILAAAVSTGLSTLLQLGIMSIYYHKVIGIKMGYLFVNIFKGILSFQFFGAIIGFVVGILIENIYVAFLCAGFTYVIVAFGGFWLLGKNEGESQMLDKVLQKIQGARKGAAK